MRRDKSGPAVLSDSAGGGGVEGFGGSKTPSFSDGGLSPYIKVFDGTLHSDRPNERRDVFGVGQLTALRSPANAASDGDRGLRASA